jgi:hypothetical protein
MASSTEMGGSVVFLSSAFFDIDQMLPLCDHCILYLTTPY